MITMFKRRDQAATKKYVVNSKAIDKAVKDSMKDQRHMVEQAKRLRQVAAN